MYAEQLKLHRVMPNVKRELFAISSFVTLCCFSLIELRQVEKLETSLTPFEYFAEENLEAFSIKGKEEFPRTTQLIKDGEKYFR